MDFKTILTIINIFNNENEYVDFEKIKFIGDCHGDLFQFLAPLTKIIKIDYSRTIDEHNILSTNVNIKLLKNFKKPVIYYLGDLFSTHKKDNEMDFVIEKIIFQILHSSRIVKWIIGNHDMEKFNHKFIIENRILDLINDGKLILCDSFKGRILSHTCFSSSIVKCFMEFSNITSPKNISSSALTSIINKIFYDLVKNEQFKELKQTNILWNRIQNNCFKSIVGHTPGLRHYNTYEEIDKELFLNIKRIHKRSYSFDEYDLLTKEDLYPLKINSNSYENNISPNLFTYLSKKIPINTITECSTFKGRCKQVFKNDNIYSTEDETDEQNKDNLKHVAVIDFGCSYDKSTSPYSYFGISIPDFLFYDGHGIYNLTNLPVYTYTYTTYGIRIDKISKKEAFHHMGAALIINYIYFNNDEAYVLKKQHCDAAVYIHEFIDEFKNDFMLLNFVKILIFMLLIICIIVKIISFKIHFIHENELFMDT